MRVILAGQRSFGAAVFDMLLDEGHEIVAVWSPNDHDVSHASPGHFGDPLTKEADDAKLWVLPWARDAESVRQLEADLFVAAHSHNFIGRESRAATRLGGIGFHPSLLPRHRGRDAVRWTVHLGDPIAGGSVYWLTDNVDGGPIAAQDWCFVRDGDDASSLWRKRLFPMGVRLLAEVLRDLDGGLIIERPQDESVATWEPSWERPPLFRPELPQIGPVAEGYKHFLGPSR